MPCRHVSTLAELTEEEYVQYFLALRHTATALEMAYGADGMNIGLNLGVAAGAGIPNICTRTCCPGGSGTRIL